jgi:NitT/TauT family transport system substrate-binding protein
MSSTPRRILLACIVWVASISLLHAWLNTRAFDGQSPVGRTGEPFRVSFIPVTCHLTCPVNHYINEQMQGEGGFEPVRFSGFPELKEAFISGHLEATFILAPLAMSLREQGVPIKIVYLGHRDGTTMMVHKDSDIHEIADLRGKTIAVPNRFSNQRLIIFRAFNQRGLRIDEVKLVEMPPPDMPAALAVRAVDAVISGEPFMAQSEIDGYGRVLFMTKDVWPEFISCVLAVNEKIIRERRDDVQRIVDGIAQSGKWLDQTMNHRMQAADFSARHYYHQDPRLLRFVLSKPPDRVKYTNLALHRQDFEEIEALAVESGILQGTVRFEDYADASFVKDETTIQPYAWEGSP